jgi:hypothetical protein
MSVQLVLIKYLRHVDDEDGGPPVPDSRGGVTYLAMGECGRTLALSLNSN